MAYYGSGFGDNEEIDANHWASHDTASYSEEVVPYAKPVSYSHSQFPAPNYIDGYESYETRPEINYSSQSPVISDSGYVSCYNDDVYKSCLSQQLVDCDSYYSDYAYETCYSGHEPVSCDMGNVPCYGFDAYGSYGSEPEIGYGRASSYSGDVSSYGEAYECYGARPEVCYSMYNLTEPKLITYAPPPCEVGYVSCYSGAYGSDSSQPVSGFNYNAYSCPKPLLMGYVSSDTGYIYETHSKVSYSKAGAPLDDLDFKDYDPTPFSGGYDPVATYGKPLPPSDDICYPLSTHGSNDSPDDSFLGTGLVKKEGGCLEIHEEPDSLGVVEESDVVEPQPKPKPEPEPEADHSTREIIDSDPKSQPEGGIETNPEIEDSGQGKEVEVYTYPDHVYDDYPWPEYDYWIGNGRRGGGYHDYGVGRQVVGQGPSEYDADVVDLCESLFGHWPCLARRQRLMMKNKTNGNKQDVDDQGSSSNLLERTIDYLFGCPVSSV